MTYATPDYRLNPPDDAAEDARIRAEELASHEGRAVAQAALARFAHDVIAALAYVAFEWADSSFVHEESEAMVRRCACEVLLDSCPAADAALWREILDEGTVASVVSVMERRAAIAEERASDMPAWTSAAREAVAA